MGSDIIANEREGAFTVAGLNFRVHLPGQPVISTSKDEIVILKPAHFLRKYDPVFGSLLSRNVLEVGIAEGGSIIYFALAFPSLKFVGIDLRPPSDFVLGHIDRLGLSSRIKLYYHTDQADTPRIHEIIRENFGNEPLGAVTEDASHFYAPSKKTFESTFGLIAPGGTYCLEDWAWAHEPGPCQSTVWMDQPALSNLLFEITLLQPSVRDLVGKITIDPNLAFIERGPAPPVAKLNMDSMILSRGKRIQLI
jgi:hypothetical protein